MHTTALHIASIVMWLNVRMVQTRRSVAFPSSIIVYNNRREERDEAEWIPDGSNRLGLCGIQ